MSPVVGLSNIIVIFIFLSFWTAGFAVFYHLTRFGVGTLPKRLAAGFLVGSVFVFCTALISYLKIDLVTLLS
jgi:hypothetical protein